MVATDTKKKTTAPTAEKKETKAAAHVHTAKEAPHTHTQATDHKAEEKKETATSSTAEKKESKNAIAHKAKAEVKRKYIHYVKHVRPKKSKEVLALQKAILNKKNVPTFRGRFGKRNIRRISIAKWDKWRKPHGIDLDKGLQHGFRPKIGYRNSVATRYIHPSGFREVLVANMNDLNAINPKTTAARFAAAMGKRKRNALMTVANEKGIWVLN